MLSQCQTTFTVSQKRLIDILRGCLDPSTVHVAEQSLKEYSRSGRFIEYLLQLIPDQYHQLLMLVMSTLKNYILACYNSDDNLRISEQQKSILRVNILNIYYEINNDLQAVNLYEYILYAVIAVDYENWPDIHPMLQHDLGQNVSASAYFFRQVSKVYYWFLEYKQRQHLENFVFMYFPAIENIIYKILGNYNEATARVLYQLLKCFYSSFHIEILNYLRDFSNMDRWILYFRTILAGSFPSASHNRLLVSRIYLKFFSVYCRDEQDGKIYKGWARYFRYRYALRLFEYCVNYGINIPTDSDIASTFINCVHYALQFPALRYLLNEYNCHTLIYGKLLSMAYSTIESKQLFIDDAVYYIRRYEDLTCNTIRRAVFDLIELIVHHYSFGQKSELIKLVEYAAGSLEEIGVSVGQREVMLRLLCKLGSLILKNKYLKGQFEQLTVRYFLQLLKEDNPLLNALTCYLLSVYLSYAKLSEPTVYTMLALVYEKITNSPLLVLKYNAILAFTYLLDQPGALKAARPHFQTILYIYVRVLYQLDHYNLISCIYKIVKNFSTEIAVYAPDLVNHLIGMFYALCKNVYENYLDYEDDNNTAKETAALSTIKQILQSELSYYFYYNLSEQLTHMLIALLKDLSKYFDYIISLYNVLVYNAKTIADFYIPYVFCRRLLYGKSFQLNVPGSHVSFDIQYLIINAYQADCYYYYSLISIVKNLIQKMPTNILFRYALPTHHQLLLCLIENKRIENPVLLTSLDLGNLDQLWVNILQSYVYVCYQIGSVCDTGNIRVVPGLSLYPWLTERLGVEVVRMVIQQVQDDDSDDEDIGYYNTMQMLYRFANYNYYYEYFSASAGMSYNFLYDSPFDSAKDKYLLLFQLRNLPQYQAGSIMGLLTPQQRKALEGMFV